MEIETVFGVKWKIPSIYEISLILGIILLVIIIFIILKYIIKLKEKKAHLIQLLLFKANQLDLSNYQIKILNGIVNSLKLKNPNIIFNNVKLFESSIGKFLSFLNTQDEHEESLNSIFKDIIMIYQKLYHPSDYKKPLDDIKDLEIGQILYLTVEKQNIFLGKLMNIENDHLSINLLSDIKYPIPQDKGTNVIVYLWRTGDAEYTFNSYVIEKNQNRINITIPENITRGQEVRHPNINTDIPCIIAYNPHRKFQEKLLTESSNSEESEGMEKDLEYEEVEALLFKLNINEGSLRVQQKLLFDHNYFLNFELYGFKMKIVATIISERTIEKNDVYYYTFKFKDMTDASKEVLHKYMMEHLFVNT